jgi:hypothetical protein
LASPIDPNYGVPLAPLQTITIPEGPALLTAPTNLRVVATHGAPFFVAQPPHLTQPSGPHFIQTIAGPVAHHLQAAPIAVAAPLAFAAPAPVPVIASPTAVQHHSQDEFGAFNYGYQDVNSAKEEIHTPDGVTRGSYSYVDANGLLQRVDYIADPINGFRVAGTNIPVGPGPVISAGPVAVVDTPEVSAAKAEFQRAFAEAEAAAALAPEESDD